jgi:hypothetical protein
VAYQLAPTSTAVATTTGDEPAPAPVVPQEDSSDAGETR